MKINIGKWLLSPFFKSSPFLSYCLLQEKTPLSFLSLLHYLCPSQLLIILGDLFSYSISFNIFQCKIRLAFSAEGTDPVCALWLANILQWVANLRLRIRTESQEHAGRKEWAEYSTVPPKKVSSKQWMFPVFTLLVYYLSTVIERTFSHDFRMDAESLHHRPETWDPYHRLYKGNRNEEEENYFQVIIFIQCSTGIEAG